VARPRRVGGADRVDPQLLAKFTSKIHVSGHGVEASGEWALPSAILPGVDRERYRRRQRRRAIIGWAAAALLVALIAAGVIFGGEAEKRVSVSGSAGLFSAEMTSRQYVAIHKGESESTVLMRLHDVGLLEDEVAESELLALFPPRPSGTVCSYWTLSDAPGHLVRLCFSDPEALLVQKAVAARGEGAERAPTTPI